MNDVVSTVEDELYATPRVFPDQLSFDIEQKPAPRPPRISMWRLKRFLADLLQEGGTEQFLRLHTRIAIRWPSELRQKDVRRALQELISEGVVRCLDPSGKKIEYRRYRWVEPRRPGA